MQLRIKKVCLLSTIFVYCFSFLLQSNLWLFQAWAQWSPDPVNIVTILVDDRILGWINSDLKWYATEYIQLEKIPNSKALVIPLDVTKISAYDIHRMMENIYFDGLRDVPSTLVGLIMFWDIPLPVVNQNWYVFPTVYPYVDFEDQKYVWDSDTEYFVPNDNPGWQAEIWHWLINYWTDIEAYTNVNTGFFAKVKKYDSNPEEFIWKSIRYDDFISQKKTFLSNNFPYYRNRIMFAEDLWYQRYSPLMKSLFEWEQMDSISDTLSYFAGSIWTTDEIAQQIWVMKDNLSNSSYTTKVVQQEIDTSYVSDYNDLFSQVWSSMMRENIFAWSRWIKEHADAKWEKSLILDSDTSVSKIQLKDDLILWNENLQWLIENLNDLMEKMVDKKIEEKHLAMDIVVPVSYKKVTKKRVMFKCRSLVNRFENYYFGSNARLIDNAEDLSIYRWTYRNLSSISWLSYDSLLHWKNQVKSDYDETNLKLKSIWWSYDIFSMQVEWNRWYNMFNVNGDLNIYDENKTEKNRKTTHKWLGKFRVRSRPESCDDTSKKHQCENLFDFAKRWWWWASPINLDWETAWKWRYVLSGYLASDSWRPIYEMDWFQSLLPWDDEWPYWEWRKNWKWKGPQWEATSFKSYIKYASPTQREWWNKVKWAAFLKWYEVFENHTPDVHINFSDMNYWNLPQYILRWFDSWKSSKVSDKIFSFSKKLWWCWGGGSEEYLYKVISSVVKHTSTTDDQINWIDRDKYWESWTLWQYYRDVRVKYEELRDTMTGSIGAFSWLIISVNSWNDYMSGKFNTLKGLLLNWDQNVTPNTWLQNQIFDLDSQLVQLQEQLSWLDGKLHLISQLEGGVDIISEESPGEWFTDVWDDEAESFNAEELNWKIEDIKQNIDDLNQYIGTIRYSLDWVDSEELDSKIEILKQKVADLKLFVETITSQSEWVSLGEFDDKIWELNENIDGLRVLVENVKIQLAVQWGTIQSTLDEISEYIEQEKKQLTTAYGLVMSLYTDDIIWALEFIAYLEWWRPDQYYEWDSNLPKVWFLPSWIDNIDNMFLDISGNVINVVSGYEEVYSLILEQQQYWFELADDLKEINDVYSESIDKVTGEMEQIFTIVADDNVDDNLDTVVDETEEPGLVVISYVYTGWRGMAAENKVDIYWSGMEFSIDSPIITWYRADIDSVNGVWKGVSQRFTVTYSPINDSNWNNISDEEEEDEDDEAEEVVILSWWTASDAMEVFGEELAELSKFFSNLIKEDEVWPAIVEAAKNDGDFKWWLDKNSINYNEFSDVDWINQYAQWAKWPWYDSQWARENHDLLLWVSEHMFWMNLLTPDRPIDSPRYVSMQSVAWNEMKFIYPDLFKVEVYELSWRNHSWYDMNLLLTWWQIKKNLVKYLSWKVEEYNIIIKKECDNALSMDLYSTKLFNLWYFSATPNKSIHSCNLQEYFTYEDFVEALWWEKMLDTISEVLYYQSLTNKRKLSAWNVDKDIEFIKDTFSLNDKRRQILEDYLVEWNEKTKNLVFEIPTYEMNGYEVAYINSDWKDYIFPSEELNEKTSKYNFGGLVLNGESDLLDTKRRQLSDDENRMYDECNIPVGWKLPLFDGTWSPWLSWFNCWLKQVKQKAFKLSLTFDSSLGEVLAGDLKFKDYVEGLGSDLEQPFIDWKDSWSNYADERNEILNKKDSDDSDATITELQVAAERHNKEVSGWEDWTSNLMAKINRDIRIETSSLLLSDANPVSDLKISSVSDLWWKVEIIFQWTGDWCINIDSFSLCNGKTHTISFDPKKNPFVGKITVSSGNVAWKVGLIVEIKVAWNSIKKVIKYTVSPSVPKKVVLKVKSDDTKKQVVVIGGMMLPIEAVLYDNYDNKVSWWLEKYKFKATTWRFLKDWWYMDSFETNDFRDLNFYYEVPQNYENEVDIQIFNQKDEVIGTLPIHVIEATLETKIDEILVDDDGNICHMLWYADPNCCPPSCWCSHSSCKSNCTKNWKVVLAKDWYENIYVWWKLDVNKLHKITMDLKDKDWKLMNIDNQAIVTSQKGLLVLGQVNKNVNWDDVFFETSKFYMTWWHIEAYYYLTTVAGDDTIKIDIPWVISRTIDFEIVPATCRKTDVKLKKWFVELWVPDSLEFFMSDIFWNTIKYGTTQACYNQIRVNFPNLEGESDPLCGWNEEAGDYNYSVWPNIVDGHAEEQIVWLSAGTTEVGSLQFEVTSHLLPNTWLNVMYLNYFGNDRWNQWWYMSENNKYIEWLMMNSKKIIATTTQLVSEDKIKKMIWRIDPWLKIVNYDNLSTTMTFRLDAKWNIQIKPNWLADEISVKVWFGSDFFKSFNSLQDVNFWVSNQNVKDNSYIIYVPSASEYEISNKMDLYSNWEKIWSLYSWNMVMKLTNQLLNNGDNIWNLMYNWVNYWSIVVHSPYAKISKPDKAFASRYTFGYVFSKWSTNSMSSIWVFDEFSDFDLDTSYKSIQNSDDLDERVWFIWDFKNITLFAEWESVWEATKKFWSELLINLWDPVLSLKKYQLNKNAYGMNYDWWVWREIYEDWEGGIFWTYIIDYDANWIDDLLVAYLDWRFKLAKNYASDPKNYDMRNLQELMRLAVPIKQIFVWDADGNWFDDIIVYTQNNQMRAYLNNWWSFDVDGNVVCLNQNVYWWEKSSSPSNLEWINQFFIEDMDLDGAADIVVYDAKWYIKVFYGGWMNYLSKEKYACDGWWYGRQKWNITEVAAFWLKVGWKVVDDSMIYRKWIEDSEMYKKIKLDFNIEDPSQFGVNIDVDNLKNLIKLWDRNSDWSIEDVTKAIMDTDNFDVVKASEKFVEQQSAFVDVTLYENTLVWWWDSKNYVFVPIGSLWEVGSPCGVSKEYRRKDWEWILVDWDVVTVRISVSCTDVAWAFWDVIKWPRNVYYDEDGIIKSFRFIWDNGGAVVKKKDWNFAYIVDNIQWKVTFEYDLVYRHVPLKKMSITRKTYRSDDEYPDIKLQSIDWCVKDFSWYVAETGNKLRLFSGVDVPLQEMINKEYLEEEKNTQDFTEYVFNAWSDVTEIPWLVWDKIARIKLLQDNGWTQEIPDYEIWDEDLYQRLWEWFKDGYISVNLVAFEKEMEEIDAVIDELMKWMCNWFSFWWANNCKWLPVPFNQAFLAPWKYHLFGCWDLPMWKLEDWIPAFFFPGNLWPIYWVYLPVPYLPSWPTDEFLWVKSAGWPWSSFIRIYAAPTLTAQLWVAICMWPSAVYNKLVSPFSELWWNCVVFALKPQCKNDDNSDRKKDKDNPNEVYTEFTEDVKDSGVCTSNASMKWSKSSPFWLYSYNASYDQSAISRDDIIVDEDQIDDILDDIQKLVWWDVRKVWDNALKWSLKGAWNVVTLWMFDKIFWKDKIDKIYDKYFHDAELTAYNGAWISYPEFSANYLWIINLETESYAWFDDGTNSRNSLFIWDVDVLWWDFSVNKIRWWIQQWIKWFLIDNWLDPQIRYIANQLTKMHINIKLPNMQSLVGEAQKIKDMTNDYTRVDTWWASKLWAWSYMNYDNLNNLSNEPLANPFESFAAIMNKSDIINVSIEPITVKVPWIFAEDINSYELYLRQWWEVNKNIFDQWSWTLNALLVKCDNISDEKEKEICYNKARSNLASFVNFEAWDWTKMQNQIYANLRILQEYRNFPFEVYEWIHVIDRYVSEIISLVSNTIWYLSYWTSVNSERFVWYVDAIILAINIIKTYQIVIDFSKEWSKNCGTCSRDTYDQYSCKLSILCKWINLPIIQIPNFKLPNITLDLSNIDLSLDIVLPSFNFQPVKIALPEIPNLPEPPAIWANIRLFDLPNIPLLPEPPELPELPSFIPEIDMELPILPPAPELPEIPNSLEGALNLSKMIWKIYCIVKWKFGLVWESSVKAKIEQLTQRTYEVSWIDNIKDFTNWTPVPVKNYWLDYEISSYVDFQFNFSTFYDYLDTLTTSINNLTTSTVKTINEKTNNFVNNEDLLNALDSVESKNIQFDLNLGMLDDSSINNLDVDGILSDEIKYTGYESAKSMLQNVLAQFKVSAADTTFADSLNASIDKIENQINLENVVEPNIQGLEKVEGDLLSYLNDEKVKYNDLADLIYNDYDWFLAMIDSQDTDSKLESWELLTFDVQLFNVDSSTRDNIDMIVKSNPYEDLLSNKKEIVDWYWNAVNSNSATDLWVSESQYLVMREGIWKMRNQISSLYFLTKPVSSTDLNSKNWDISTSKTLLSATSSEWRLWSNIDVAEVVDPSSLSIWIYDKIVNWADAWKLAKVVYSDSFAWKIWSDYFKVDRGDYHDIILYDDKSVYIKCKGQDCFTNWWWFAKYYLLSNPLEEIPYKEAYVKFDGDTILKIADSNGEVKNWKVAGQSYDNISFSWRLENVDGYLIDLTQKIDYNYEKNFEVPPIYVLALPNWSPSLNDLYVSWTRLELIGNNDKNFEKIGKLYWTWKQLVQVVYYDVNQDLATITLSDVDRKWYYARIASLDLIWDSYEISSPWSNQVVAWKQILWDELWPEWEAVLYRPSADENVSQWNSLEWYVWTRYNLIVNWDDDVSLSYINLSKDWEILDEKYTSQVEDSVSAKIDIHTKWGEKEVYNSVWVDQFGNRTEKVITVSYSVPEISITNVSKNADWKTALIKAELSQDIDQWNVSFQRKRWNVWKTMRTNDAKDPDISLARWKTLVEWLYSAGSEIAIYDKNDKVMALINPDTAEIKFQPWYEDKYGVRVDVQDSLVLQIFDKKSQNQNSIFSIYLPVEECSNIDVGNYRKENLDEVWKMGMFNWWTVIFDKDWNNVLFISPTCHLYSEWWLEWEYSYDSWNKYLKITLYQKSDLKENNPIKLLLKVKPLVLD